MELNISYSRKEMDTHLSWKCLQPLYVFYVVFFCIQLCSFYPAHVSVNTFQEVYWVEVPIPVWETALYFIGFIMSRSDLIWWYNFKTK